MNEHDLHTVMGLLVWIIVKTRSNRLEFEKLIHERITRLEREAGIDDSLAVEIGRLLSRQESSDDQIAAEIQDFLIRRGRNPAWEGDAPPESGRA